MTGTEPMDFFEQQQVQQEIARLLATSAPPNWTALKLTFRSTVPVSSSLLEVTFPDGSSEPIESPIQARMTLIDLRSGMYQEETGTWYTAICSVDRSGSYSFNFDYDNEPDFVPQLVNASFTVDLEYFPRDDEHIPAWLRSKLTGDPDDNRRYEELPLNPD